MSPVAWQCHQSIEADESTLVSAPRGIIISPKALASAHQPFLRRLISAASQDASPKRSRFSGASTKPDGEASAQKLPRGVASRIRYSFIIGGDARLIKLLSKIVVREIEASFR